MDKTKIFLDLSKCTEEEQIKVISLLPEPIKEDDYDITDLHLYLIYDDEDCIWWISTKYFLAEKTELTYPEFIKLFEGGENKEVLQVENNYQDLKESHSELFRRLNQLRNRYKLDNLDKCLCRAKEINRKYANNKSFKIVQSDKNNVFFLDECIFTYCPTPNECKNGGCLSKSNNQ